MPIDARAHLSEKKNKKIQRGSKQKKKWSKYSFALTLNFVDFYIILQYFFFLFYSLLFAFAQKFYVVSNKHLIKFFN